MPTPHITAELDQIAPLVIMPGDPNRAERIAKDFFTNPQLVSDVRKICAWTGTFEGTPMTAMASGMGIPSISIYASELYRHYNVQRIVRVGTCGAIMDDVKVRDVVIGMSAHTNSNVANINVPDITLSLTASFDMLRGAVAKARSFEGTNVKVGALYSSDFFYLDRPDIIAGLEKIGTLGVEMESAGLYACALQAGREALTVCTVSDHLKNHSDDMSAEERETRFVTALQISIAGLLA